MRRLCMGLQWVTAIIAVSFSTYFMCDSIQQQIHVLRRDCG